MPNKDVVQLSKADKTAREIQLLFLKTIRDVLEKIEREDIDYTQLFNLEAYPFLNKLIDEAIKKLASRMTRVINNATKSQWEKAWEKNQGIASQYLKRNLLTEAQQKAHQSRNDSAYESFQNRKLSGLKLSDRVWQYANQFKGEIELGVDDALKEGTSAETLSRKIRKNLQNPNDLFRRVRDKHGVLQLSKAMAKYHPSGGVYRSSYKNAMRLARTEVNMAYRASDHEQYKQMDFVLGYEIKRSNNIYSCGVCEELKGIYPKDFKFVGWHPQCRCYTVPILNPLDDFIAQQKALLAGEEYEASKPITSLPKNFSNWFKDNRDKIGSIKKSPYFVRDNLRFILERTSLDEVMAKARESGSEVDWLARSLAKDFGGYTTSINFKGEGSILRKVRGDYEGQFSQLQDAVRTTIIVPENQIEALKARMESTGLFSRIKSQEAEDYMGYSGTITNLRTENGLFAEIQINTERMIFAKEKPKFAKQIIGLKRWNEIRQETGLEGGLGHVFYEKYRVLDKNTSSGRLKREELSRLSFAYYENFRGTWKTASLGVAPTVSSSLIESIDDLEKALSKNNYGDDLVKTINEAADSLGIEILNNHSSVGGWYSSDKDQTIKEASKRIKIKYKTQEQADAFASFLGALAPEAQEGIYLAQYTEEGKDFEHRLGFDTNKNAEFVINKLNDFGLGDGFSYDAVTKQLYIGDIGREKLDNILELATFAKDYGLIKHTYEKANISFPSRETYQEALQGFRDSFVKEGKSKWNSFNSLFEEASKKLGFKFKEPLEEFKTIKEAERWAERNLLNVRQVDYSTFTLDQANRTNKQLLKLQKMNIIKSDEKFNIKGIIGKNGTGGSYQMLRHTHSHMGGATLKIDGSFDKTYKKLLAEETKKSNASKRAIKKNIKLWEAELKALENKDIDLLDGRDLDDLKTLSQKIEGGNRILSDSSYWSLEKIEKNARRKMSSQAGTLEEAIIHEFGHILQADMQTHSELYSDKIKNHILKIKKKYGWNVHNPTLTYSGYTNGQNNVFGFYTDSVEAFRISEYATTNGFETFAEAWLQYNRTGKTDIADLNELFDLITKGEIENDWKKDLLKDKNGLAIEGFHGTTHALKEWNIERQNISNYWGRAFYFSNSSEDARLNYAQKQTNEYKIGDVADKIYEAARFSHVRTLEDYEENRQIAAIKYPWFDFKKIAYQEGKIITDYHIADLIAREMVYGGAENTVYNVFFELKNPFIINMEGGDPSNIDYDSFLTYKGKDSDTLPKFLESIKKSLEYHGHGDKYEAFEEEILKKAKYGKGVFPDDVATRFKDRSGKLGLDQLKYNGNYVNGEILRKAIEMAGYDGIIEYDVWERLGVSINQYGKRAEGIEEGDTAHIIVFNKKSLKNVNDFWNDTYLPDVIESAKKEKDDSFNHYYQNGNWTSARKKLHDQIIKDLMNQNPSQTGTSYFLGGATANGKSTLVDSGALPHPKNAIVINSDEIKKMIPEYMTMLGMSDKQAAAFVHEESSYLSKRLIANLQRKNIDFVLDGVNDGSIDKIMKKVNLYKKSGAKRIRADYVSLDTDLSVFLAEKRAKKEGRYVPLNVVVDANREISNLIPDIIDAKAFDELYLWDTNIEGKKRLILKQIDGKLTIADEKLYERFLSKGGEKSNILSKIWDGMKEKEQEIKERETELAVFYDKLGNFISEKSGSRTHVEIDDLPEDAYMLTHNHYNNSSLSRGDLSFLMNRSQLKVIRAIGRNGITYEMRKLYDHNALNWKQVDFNQEWAKAEEYADNEVETWIKKKYGVNWSSIYWKENEKREQEAIEVLGRHSDRMNWWMANKSKYKSLFVYRKYRT